MRAAAAGRPAGGSTPRGARAPFGPATRPGAGGGRRARDARA